MDDMEAQESKKHAIDQFLGHIPSELSGTDIPYSHLGTPASIPNHPHIWTDYGGDTIGPGFLHQSNLNSVFLQENYTSHAHASLPFKFNSSDEVLPGMVGGGNFVVYGNNNHRNQNWHNLHPNKIRGSVTTCNNNYNVDSIADYNLFSGNIPTQAAPPQGNSIHPQFCNSSGNSPAQTHLIESLVGNWSVNQNGTYSPFGDSSNIPSQCCIRSVGEQEPLFDTNSIGRGTKRARIVAQVRPMRLSYSDVLSKSINKGEKNRNNKPDVNKTKIEDKTKFSKSNNVKANGVKVIVLKRQHSSGSDEQVNTSSSNTLNKNINNTKKQNSIEPNNTNNPNKCNLSKKWASLDDLESRLSQEDRKKDIRRKKEKWETVTLNNSNNSCSTSQKKPLQINNNLHCDKNTETKGQHIKNRALHVDQNKGQNNNQTKNEQKGSVGNNGVGSAGRRNNVGQGSNEKGSNKKSQRGRRKEQQTSTVVVLRQRIDQFCVYFVKILYWFINLIYDVCRLSTNLAFHSCSVSWDSIKKCSVEGYYKFANAVKNTVLLNRILNFRFGWFWSKDEKRRNSEDEVSGTKTKNKLLKGLDKNIPLPSTGEEAMKRLLACKGKDPYSILGVTHNCTDDDIKKYYKRQAFLVHPDKNSQPGAEEAFKILIHAFDIIGEPEHRKSYDRRVEETQQVEQAWSELSELLSQLHKKMEYAANTIRCTNCGKRHKRTLVDRPIYAARMCNQCKIHHAVREGDIWAETTVFGLIWRYYACMDGAVYDISEWAGCQGNNIKHLKPNTHNVQYRIVLGKQSANQKQHTQPSEPDFEEFLNNLYNKSGKANGSNQPGDNNSNSQGRNKRKSKRKK